jgi:hypothetical protein
LAFATKTHKLHTQLPDLHRPSIISSAPLLIRQIRALKTAHAPQDAIKVEQPGGPGKFEVPKWDDPVSQKKIRDGRRLLVHQSLQRRRIFSEERA